ncbi:14164_t:CDS:10 [Ambispora leptoticha]|uniref:Eukaryotic translation initiation factor 3 subunit J n=1 Tax=Ambispora leptoticha TaxID=144679 RepID=A0A9N9BIM2_9GLOM|nr:14164_t:CDS:10 [Ambispora leptoticha]
MSTSHDAISSADRSGQDGAAGADIDQLLNLIDTDLAAFTHQNLNGSIPQGRTWDQQNNRVPASNYTNLSNNNISNAIDLQSTTTNRTSSQSSQISQMPALSYNNNNTSSGLPQPYNGFPQPYNNPTPQTYTALQQQYYAQHYFPYQQYHNSQNYHPTYYPSYPQDLTSQGWLSNSQAYSNVGSRPLPRPPGTTTPYSNAPITYMNPYNYYSSIAGAQYHSIPNNGTVVPSSTSTSQYNIPQKVIMPDFTTYVDPSSSSTPVVISETDSTHNNSHKPIPPPIHIGGTTNINSPNVEYPTQSTGQSAALPYDAYPADSGEGISVQSNLTRPASMNYPSGKEPIYYSEDLSSTNKVPLSHTLNGMMNHALLSNIALAFRATVKLGTHENGALEYPESFTGADAVSTIHSLLPPSTPRRIALNMARSLEAQLYFHSVDWSISSVIKDTQDEVYTFLNPSPGTPTALEWDEDFPTGVFPSVGKCYSSRCGVDGKGCYSRTCLNYTPSEVEIRSEVTLNRQLSVTSEISDTSTLVTRPQERTWIGSVPKEISDKIDKDERKRQEIIYETIYTEEDYVTDLDLLEEGLRKASPPIIPQVRFEAFIQDVFFNVFEIRKHNKRMLEKLRERQREGYIVEKIGDIFLECALDFGNDYILYNGHFPLADAYIKDMKNKNPEFRSFLESCSRRPEARKLDFRHFVQRPTQRLQRYTLLLEQVIKYTPKDNPDREVLENAWQTIKELCRESDTKVHEAEKRLKIMELERKLVKKNGEICPELRLLDPNRTLVFKGELKKRRLEWLELYVFLFDHYFVMTKPRKGNDGEIKYQISKKIIPLEMLKVDTSPEQSQLRTFKLIDPRKGKSNTIVGGIPGVPLLENQFENPDNLLHQKSLYPFTIIHLGKNGGSFQLFADSANTRKIWKDKIIEAQTKLQLSKSHQQVFELFTLDDANFASSPAINFNGGPTAAWKGKVNCSVPFVTPEKRNMVAIGTDDGVWMGFGGETKTFRHVLRLSNVMQMAVLEDYAIFVVLADKLLLAYSLEVMIPSSNNPQASGSQASKHPQRLSNNANVQYFSVGTIKDKTLLIYLKKRSLESHFKVLEPIVAANSNERSRGLGGFGSRRFGLAKNDWFKEYKQFYIPSESYSINFLRSKLCVVCTRGFEIVNLETLQNGTIPDFASPQFEKIARKCENSKPLGMFRLGDNEFLLCYDEIFFYVDKHGELSRQKTVEWEGKPTAVAMQYPYVIGFDPQFIEVRHVQTGELAQIITGSNMQCLNDNSSGRHAIHGVMQHPFNETYYIFQLVMAEVRRTNSIVRASGSRIGGAVFSNIRFIQTHFSSFFKRPRRMAEDWEDQSSDELPVPLALPTTRKWDDEDKDDGQIKEAWDESEEEQEKKVETKTQAEPAKKKSPLSQKIAEREARNKENDKLKKQQKQYEEEEDPVQKKNLLRQLQVDADLENTANAFGVDLEDLRGQLTYYQKDTFVTLDTIDPKNKEEFEEFSQLLIARIRKHEKQGYYPTFLINLFRELCFPLKDIDVRKASSTLAALANEKAKALKESNKPKKKGKKPFLATEKSDTTDYTNLDDEFDDFM